jgi:hypothetical protein
MHALYLTAAGLVHLIDLLGDSQQSGRRSLAAAAAGATASRHWQRGHTRNPRALGLLFEASDNGVS